ncbi:unnamed protein product [Brachionus calyciflorus]|uniref:beta-glucosidase n=1 Tax=Brachionus calyciflorus TaxID=104777 RepID=A0A814H451_9BILA|nr:unnamed protein product [Brachionus calyciflorus]
MTICFKFDYEVLLVGVHINSLPIFILICIVLFTIGIFSEFLSFFQYCVSTVAEGESISDLNNMEKEKDNSMELSSLSSSDSLDNLIGHNVKSSSNDQAISNHEAHFDLIKYHPFDIDSKLLFQIDHFRSSRIPFFLKTLYKLGQILIGYVLMLIIMSFNFWFLLSILLGYMFGYYLFFRLSKQEVNIQELLDSMSNEDKCGQMTQLGLDVIQKNNLNPTDQNPIDYEKLKFALKVKKIGSFINPPPDISSSTWQLVINTIQNAVLNETSLKIPVIYATDSIHGASLLKEGVLFPQPLAQASTFNLDIAYRIGEITALESRAAGIPWNFNPVLDIGRQALWPRLYETYGEDVYLASKMGYAYILGHQGNDIKNRTKSATCLKHYLGYSLPFNGRDRTPAYIPDNVLREFFLPPFEAGVEAGAQTVMINSAHVNDIPGHANSYYINDILKGELKFKGFTVSDWQDVIRLHTRDKVAETPEEAVRIAVMSGVDMSMVPSDYSFFDHCVNLTKKNEKFLNRVNDAVTRILTVKKNLGLFENPFANAEDLNKIGTNESEEFNLEAARESIILAKNKGILPLQKLNKSKILVTGPTGNIIRTLSSGWSYTWQGESEDLYHKYGRPKLSIFEAIRKKHQGVVEYTQGVLFDKIAQDFDQTIQVANNSDYIVLCIGEDVYAELPGNINNLIISESQIKLAKAFFDLRKPVIVVYTAGRPRVITDIAEKADAVLVGFLTGTRGGEAIADVIFGDYNPNGRMPVSYPKYPNGYTTYDFKPMENFELNSVEHLYPFGHGLSYTEFSYASLTLNTSEIKYPNDLQIKVNVKNIGKLDGKETVILYLNDEYGSLTRPVKQMKRFSKVFLKAGETKQIDFVLTSKDLSFINYNSQRVVEPGRFIVYVGNLTDTFLLKM